MQGLGGRECSAERKAKRRIAEGRGEKKPKRLSMDMTSLHSARPSTEAGDRCAPLQDEAVNGVAYKTTLSRSGTSEV